MTKDELASDIREKFRQGERRSEIKEELIQQGYYEEDIDEAIKQIQSDAIKQLPGISSFYHFLERFEKKSNLTTTKMTILLMVFCIGVLLLVASILYVIFDPLGTGAGARDAERTSDTAKMQTALGYYYQLNAQYPASLNDLVPKFLKALPLDPKSGDAYVYKQLTNGSDYELCITYEMQQSECLYAAPVSSNIPIIPTETPVPVFVPQGASDSPQPSQGTVQGGNY